MLGQRFLSRAIGALATLTVLVAGCSGSSTSVPVAPISAPLAPVLPPAVAFAGTSTVAPPASTSATTLTLPLPQSTAYSGTATFPVESVPPNLRLTLTYSNAAPTGLAPFAAARQSLAAQREPLDASNTNAVYACFAANYVVKLDGAPQYQFVLPAGWDPPGIAYYLALWQSGQWVSGYGGPGAIAATSSTTLVTVAGGFPFVIPADGKICVALYGRWMSAPTPVPATPAPSTVLAVTAAPVAMNGAGAVALTVGTPETLSIAPTDGPATATTTCATNAMATLDGSPGTSFTLVGTKAGTCAVTLTNNAGKSGTVQVIVSPAASPSPSPIVSQSPAPTVSPSSTPTVRPSATPTSTPTATPSPTSSPTATPTSAPTPTPTSTPTATPTPSLSPTSLTFTNTGVAQSLTATETNYSGVLTQSNTCSGIATVSPASRTGPSGSFTVTSVSAGSCTVTITDSAAHTVAASISVTTLGATIQSKMRQL